MSYRLEELADDVLVEVVYIEKIEQLTIPVELQIDLGAIQIGQPSASPVAPKVEQNVSPQMPGGMQSARLRPSPNVLNAAARPPVERPVAVASTQWPPQRPAANWPTTQPTIAWPARRPAIAFPTTRPAGGEQATGPRLPVYNDASVSIVGLGVYKTPVDSIRSKWGAQPDLFFRPNGGTILRLMLAVRDRVIVDVDSRNLRVNRFADDTGAELSTSMRRLDRNLYYVTPTSSLSSDGQHSLLNLTLEDAPSAGATRFLLSGDVTTRLSMGVKTEEQKDVAVAVGCNIKAGSVSFTIKSLSAEPRGVEMVNAPSAIFLTLQSDKPLDAIRSIQFITADGEEIRCAFQKPVVAVDQPSVQREYFANCTLGKAIDRATVRVTYFDQVETVSIPIQLMAGVGL
jgi:hypothetical protein